MIIIKLSFNRLKYCKICSNNFGNFSNFCNFRKFAKKGPIFGAFLETFQTFRKQKLECKLRILFTKLISFYDTILMIKIKISKKLLTFHLTGGIDCSQGGDKDEFV